MDCAARAERYLWNLRSDASEAQSWMRFPLDVHARRPGRDPPGRDPPAGTRLVGRYGTARRGTDARPQGPKDAAAGGPKYQPFDFEKTNLPIGPSSGLSSSGRHRMVSSILRASVKSLSVMPPAE